MKNHYIDEKVIAEVAMDFGLFGLQNRAKNIQFSGLNLSPF